MESNNKLSPKVTKLFSRRKKLNISLVFTSQPYFEVPKTIRLNATHYFITKIPNKRALQQIASNHLSDIDFEGFMRLYQEYTKEPCSFLVNDTTLSSNNPLRFRQSYYKMSLVRKLKEWMTKLSKTKLNRIKTEKLLDSCFIIRKCL